MGLHDDSLDLNQEAYKQVSSTPPQPKESVSNAHTEVEEALCNAVGTKESVTAVPVVPFRLKSAERKVLTYAMLETCSTGSFVLDEIATTLGLTGVNTQLMVKTVNGTKLHDSRVLNDENPTQLPKVFTKEDLSTPQNVHTAELAHRWKHLRGITIELPTQSPNVRNCLLIGSNCPKALKPIDVLAIEDGGPFAIRTFAGWAIVGPLYMCGTEHPNVNCHRFAAMEVSSGKHLDHHFMVESRVKEIVTPQALNKMLELDFSERMEDKEQENSREDKVSGHSRSGNLSYGRPSL